jgi:hypothetical protein
VSPRRAKEKNVEGEKAENIENIRKTLASHTKHSNSHRNIADIFFCYCFNVRRVHSKTVGKAVPSNKFNGRGKKQHCDLSSFMLHIFYVSLSVVAFGRVFEFVFVLCQS